METGGFRSPWEVKNVSFLLCPIKAGYTRLYNITQAGLLPRYLLRGIVSMKIPLTNCTIPF